MVLEALIKELEEYKSYEEKYKSAVKDKEKLAEYVYENEVKKFLEESYEERKTKHMEEVCIHCRFFPDCEVEFPSDVLAPVKNKGWFPSYKRCEYFKMS